MKIENQQQCQRCGDPVDDEGMPWCRNCEDERDQLDFFGDPEPDDLSSDFDGFHYPK